MADATVGNKNLVSNEEEAFARFLRERNLEMTNAQDQKVNPQSNFYSKYIKRGLDLLISVPVFTVLLPFNLIFGVCTYFDVGKPIFYKQTRIGKNGKPFTMAKFRNMNNNTDADGKLLPASERVTKFGKFMRKFSLDELLNFWYVVKGDMSIIGPRPLPEFFVERMSERHKMRHAVRPGLECPYTVPEGSKLNNYYWKFENDIWYVENISFKTDLMMLVKLFKLTFNMSNRGNHAGGLSYFIGYDDEGHAISLREAKEVYDLESVK
ncbi:MAG: sugar transferase [Oscillospiraceae bacterium]|nr:sugar transferase [Oscillospiraceae bacterium]